MDNLLEMLWVTFNGTLIVLGLTSLGMWYIKRRE